MLRHTFCHVPGIGPEAERSLWRQGCEDWNCLLDSPEKFRYGSASEKIVVSEIRKSQSALNDQRHQYFKRKLGMSEAWRAFPEFRDSCVYLDIETDGGSGGDSITMVGLYDGVEFKALVNGNDLGQFPDIISNYSMIVTFFGSGFDVPMLQRRFLNWKPDQIHLDLCPTFRKLGIRGGLKKIEKQLNIVRPGSAEGLNGLDAIRLWRLHRYGSETALDTLIAYNREDVVNLEPLAEFAYSRLRAATFVA